MIGRPAQDDPPWFRRLWRLYRSLLPKAQAYRETFDTPAGRKVLQDFAWFCRAEASATTEREIGRRDVWLRIMRFTQMTAEERAVLYAELTPEQRNQVWSPGARLIEEE